MTERTAKITRKTKETTIELFLNLDGKGNFTGSSSLGFFDHMLNALCRHSGVDLSLEAQGDRHIDDHHLVEDLGIALGMALEKALGDMRGVRRFADATVPLDESLVLCAIDLSGRPYLGYEIPMTQERLGEFDVHLFPEFFQGLVNHGRFTLHLRLLTGGNSHHRIEAAFKAFARALGQAVQRTGTDAIPSTKGVLRGEGE